MPQAMVWTLPCQIMSLTTKSFMYQTFVDHLGLRLAIAKGINDQNGPLLNNDEVHLTGISLGGIVSHPFHH